MEGEKPQEQKQPETITPLEQKEAPQVAPEIGTEELQKHRDETKKAGEKSVHNEKTKLQRLETSPVTTSE